MVKVIQIAAAGPRLFGLCDDGSVWMTFDYQRWSPVPPLDVALERREADRLLWNSAIDRAFRLVLDAGEPYSPELRAAIWGLRR